MYKLLSIPFHSRNAEFYMREIHLFFAYEFNGPCGIPDAECFDEDFWVIQS